MESFFSTVKSEIGEQRQEESIPDGLGNAVVCGVMCGSKKATQ
jgi:hypothetical protein